jgi:hypothetical protein
MKHATQDSGNYGDDDSLEGIESQTEDGEGFGLPGQSAVGTVGSFRFADISNQDENSTGITAPTQDADGGYIDVTGEPPVANNEGLSSVSPGSLGTLINGVNEGKKMSLDARIAYVIENGEPFCNHCEKNFVPNALGARMACTYCGCGQPNNDHGLGEANFIHQAGDVADLVGDEEIIKEAPDKTASKDAVQEIMGMFKESNDSKLYYQGYYDAMDGKPLDEDLALLNDDYFHGYDQYKFYNKTPQQSSGQTLYDIKPNSNFIPRSGELTPGEADRGPLELTDGLNRATAKKIAAIYPIDVIEKFFGVN